MEIFEKDIFKKDEKSKFRLIKVIHLVPGQYIIFDTALYYHRTIIPKQDVPRSIIVVHNLKKKRKGKSNDVFKYIYIIIVTLLFIFKIVYNVLDKLSTFNICSFSSSSSKTTQIYHVHLKTQDILSA